MKTDINNSDDNAKSILLQSDGKLVVSGTSNKNNNSDFAVVRYDSDGKPDNNFGTAGISITDFDNSNDQCNSSALQSDGKIIAVGYSNGLLSDIAVARYNTDGSPDNSFGTNGKVKTDLGNSYDTGSSVTIQKNGEIIVAGSTSNGASYDIAVARYHVDGSLDNNFGDGGKVNTNLGTITEGNSVATQSDGKIVVGGSYNNGTNYDFLTLRYDTSGNLDNTFQGGGIVNTDFNNSNDHGSAVAIQQDGRIIIVGTSGNDFGVARFNTDGSPDNTFNSTGKITIDFGNFQDFGSSIAIQSDGKIIIGGSSSNGINFDFAMVRLNPDGTIDNGFGSQGKVKTEIENSEDFECCVLIQPDGRIILVGYSSVMGAGYSLSMVRYNTDGTIDNSFGTNGKVITSLGTSFGYSNSAVLQPDGKIDAVWNSSNSKNSDFTIVRFNNNGSIDNTFGNNGIVKVDFDNSNDLGSSIALQSDGKIVAAGSSDNGYSSDFAVLRYNSQYPVFHVSSQLLQFGNVFIDSSSTHSFFIKNNGSSTLNVDSIVSNNNVFSINPDKPSIAPGDSQIINIIFKPQQAQNYNGKLIIYHNAAGSPDTMNLSGTGVVKTNAIIQLSAAAINFGPVTISNSSSQSIFIKNLGTASLVIDSIISNKSVYSVNIKTLTITPGDSKEVKINFTPLDTINYSGIISIYHNASGSPSLIDLTGNGSSKSLPAISLSVSKIDFGAVTVNSNLNDSLFIKNIGTATLVIDSITIDNKINFSVSPVIFNIPPHDSQVVHVAFIPKDSITYSSTLKVYNNLPGSPQKLNLTGKGTYEKIPKINLSTKALDFKEVNVSSISKLQFEITNNGSADLKIDSIISSNKVFSASPANLNLKPGFQDTVIVTFAPTDSVSYNGTLNIYNNASTIPGKISLAGIGISLTKPIATLSTTSLIFGDVIKDSIKTLELKITNTGKADLKVDSLKSSSTIFVVIKTGFILKPDSSRKIPVTFEPKDSISYNGVLNIFHNASNNLSQVNLSGKGVNILKAEISLFTSSLSFGDAVKGSSPVLSFVVKNSGKADLKVDSIKSSSNSFSASPSVFILKPDSSKNISVTFTPQDSIGYSGTLSIYNNVSKNPSTISVSGNGFIYPAILSANQSVSFGDVKNTNNYKIIGIPGNSNLAVSSLTQGDYQYDWNVYDDNGDTANYLITSSNFKFSPGKAYWIINSSTMNISQQITPVQLSANDNTYSIPLHSSWNLISNPFEKNVAWQNVQNLNNLPGNSLLYYWNGNNWDNPFFMVPFQGYYFNNTGNLTSLKLKYEPHQSAGKISKTKTILLDVKSFLELSIEDKNINQASTVYVGIDSLSKDGIDNYDYFSPPADFQKVAIHIVKNELPAREKYLFIEQRPEIKNGQEYELEIKSIPNQQISIIVNGLQNFSKYNIYLLDERLKNLYNLRDEKNIKLNLAHQDNNFKLIIGTDEFLNQIKQQLNLAGYQLYQNYPNPFNPTTIIRFSILKQGNITLRVYNILGQLVRTIIDNQIYDAGTHEVEFNGSSLASGVYIFRLESVNYTMQRKMVLLK